MRAFLPLCLVGFGPIRQALSRFLACLDAARPVGHPLAPRPWIQARTVEPGMLQREQVMARGDAGTAVTHHVGTTDAADRLLEPRTQIHRNKEATISQVPLEEVIDGARNVSSDPVERLHVTAIAFGCTCIYEVRAGSGDEGWQRLGADRQLWSR